MRTALVEGLRACFEGEGFQALAAERGIPMVYAGPAEFEAFLAVMKESLLPALRDLGLAAE